MDSQERFSKLIAITSELADLMALENKALKDKRFADISELVEQKNALSRAYMAHVRDLSKTPGALEDIDTALRERLAGVGKRVRELMTENAELLEVAIEASRRFVDIIAEVVQDAQPAAAGTYSAAGSVGKANMAPPPVAISVDQSL
jgi:flagellar biosynthesis/type III secretory pathway chaperone